MSYSYDRTAATDIKVHDVEFASGQDEHLEESLDSGEGVITLVRAEFTVSGRTLARLLGKQMRVLETALGKMKSRQILNAVDGNREVLKVVGRVAKNMVQRYIVSDLGKDSPRLTVDFASESDLPYKAVVDARNQSVRVELEFDVGGG